MKKISILLIVMSLLVVGCKSSSTGSGGESDVTGPFVAGEGTTGSMSLRLNATSLAVGDTTTFSVGVRDVSGNAVPRIEVLCDTEEGVALVEPASGTELTDGFGNMSGVLGCTLPGSFQIGCRLPTGTNLRQFGSLLCTGDVPEGFTGFPDAGGGGLGGGVDVSDNADSGSFGLRVTAIDFFDDGTTDSTLSIDLNRDGDCDNDVDTVDPEPFFETQIQFTVQNNSNSIARFTSYTYTIDNATFANDGSGTDITSGSLSFIGEAEDVDADGGTATFTALFIQAVIGGGSTDKRFFGTTSNISDSDGSEFGFARVTVVLRGVNSDGESISATAATTASFGDFDRCG